MNAGKTIVKDGLLYTDEHEWARIEGDFAVIGISDHAQKELRNVVFVELPQVGEKLTFRKDFGYVESTKAVNSILSPVSGDVIEINSKLEENPDMVNSDPYGEGWMVKVRITNRDELKQLLDAKRYLELLEKLS